MVTRDFSVLRHIRLFAVGAVQSWYKPNKGGLSMNINYIRSGDYFVPDSKLPGKPDPSVNGAVCTGITSKNTTQSGSTTRFCPATFGHPFPVKRQGPQIQRAAPNVRCCPHFCVGYSETACGSFWRFARAATSRRLCTFSLR